MVLTQVKHLIRYRPGESAGPGQIIFYNKENIKDLLFLIYSLRV